MVVRFELLMLAYLMGSIPTALIVSRHLTGMDIRLMGDGNMGARNTKRVLGWRAGILVAGTDFFKGAIVIILARNMQMNLTWQLAAGCAAVIGHDFPIFAHFRGGQGMATSLGTMSVLFFEETLIGLVFFGLIYMITRHFDLSAGCGLTLMAYLLVRNRQAFSLLAYTVVLFLSIPFKKLWDAHHRFAQKDMILRNT